MKNIQSKQHFINAFRHLTKKTMVSRCWTFHFGPLYHDFTQLWWQQNPFLFLHIITLAWCHSLYLLSFLAQIENSIAKYHSLYCHCQQHIPTCIAPNTPGYKQVHCCTCNYMHLFISFFMATKYVVMDYLCPSLRLSRMMDMWMNMWVLHIICLV